MADPEAVPTARQFDAMFAAAGFRRRLKRCWEKQSFLCERILQDITTAEFSEKGILDTVWNSEVLRGRSEAISDGKRVRWSALGSENVPGPESIDAALRSGLTVLVRRFDLEHPATAAFACGLASQAGQPAFATLFITPQPGNTFPAHYDAANVFALQLAGIKRWNLFEQVSPLPASDADVTPVSEPKRSPVETRSVTSGDLLYVPRGQIHEVSAMTCPSFHISFGMLARPLAGQTT